MFNLTKRGKTSFHIIVMNLPKDVMTETKLPTSNCRLSCIDSAPTHQSSWCLEGLHSISVIVCSSRRWTVKYMLLQVMNRTTGFITQLSLNMWLCYKQLQDLSIKYTWYHTLSHCQARYDWNLNLLVGPPLFLLSAHSFIRSAIDS